MGRTIFALFDDALAALGVAGAFEREGHDRNTITLIVPDPRGRYAQKNPNGGDRLRVFETLSAPELGPAAITGPLSAPIADATRARGGLVGALTAVGFEEPDARHYFESLRRGQAIVAIEMAEERVGKAVELMRRLGARAVEVMGAEAGVKPEREPARVEPSPVRAEAPPAAQPERLLKDRVTVPVVEEELEVGKRQVQRGGVRIHSHVFDEPIEESVSLREERVHVERRQVYRDATEEDLAEFRDGTIEFRETVEEPVITKRRRVVEEVVIGRQTRERTERISETVKKTEVRIEDLRADEAPGPGATA